MQKQKKGGLQDTQKRKVFIAVNAYLKVSRKQFIDNVLASLRTCVLEPFQELIKQLPCNDTLKHLATEDKGVEKKRNKAKGIYYTMTECKKQLDDIMATKYT